MKATCLLRLSGCETSGHRVAVTTSCPATHTDPKACAQRTYIFSSMLGTMSKMPCNVKTSGGTNYFFWKPTQKTLKDPKINKHSF